MASNRSPFVQQALSYVQEKPLVVASTAIAISLGVAAAAAVLIPKQASYSRTAEIACLLRTLSRLEPNDKYHTRDHLATYFLPWTTRFMLWFSPQTLRAKMDKIVPAGLGWVIARTQIYDDLIESTLSQDPEFTQVVILGAGFDSRFYRLRLPFDRVSCIELDEPSTQKRKRELIDSVPLHLLPNGEKVRHVAYIPMNLDISQSLDKHPAYNPRAKTLFLWEAVTPYLTEEAVLGVLSFVKTHSQSGSLISFDIRYKEAISGEKRYAQSQLTATVNKLKESYKFGVPEGTSRQWIESLGFEAHAIYGPQELAQRVTSDTGYSLKTPDIMDIIVARVP